MVMSEEVILSKICRQHIPRGPLAPIMWAVGQHSPLMFLDRMCCVRTMAVKRPSQ